MSVTVGEVAKKMEQWCPLTLACAWDYCGLQVGAFGRQVHRILVALDVTAEVAAEAIELGADLIVTHHPLIFGGLPNLCVEAYPQSVAAVLLKADIAHYAAHTNLDMAAGGVNDVLAAALGLSGVSSLAAEGDMDGLGRIGDLHRPLSFEEFEALVKEGLAVPYLRVVPVNGPIKKVAVCGGSGMDLFAAAKKAGADCLVSAEGKHHQALAARELGIGLIDAGHFPTEYLIVPVLASYLQAQLPTVAVSVSSREQDSWLIG